MARCFFFHRWGKWETYVTEFIRTVHQRRVCKDCGYVEDEIVSFHTAEEEKKP
jgi:hypothetical protein